MCRMFGFLAARPIAPRCLLCDAPRSLKALARVHKDGWGVAMREAADWVIHRSVESAEICPRYDELVDAIRSSLVIAHVRQRTRGDVKLANTHPFRQGELVFGHNGTVSDLAPLVARTSAARRGEIEGETDSEQFFAFIATCIDDAPDVETGVTAAVRQLHGFGELGSTSFLLSNGAQIFAHRLGRSLDVLVRPDAIIVASEPLTDEAWTQLPERSLTILEGSEPQMRRLL